MEARKPLGFQVHVVTELAEYFHLLSTGERTFELRNNDRGYKRHDEIVLREATILNGKMTYSGRSIHRRIRFVLDHTQIPGLLPGFVAIQLEKLED